MWLKRLAIGLLCVAAFSCKKAVPDSELVAKVNEEGITKADFEAMVERNMARYRGQGHALPPGIETRIKESVLRRMIDDKVIELKAKAIGVLVTPEELEKKFSEHKDRFRTDQAFQDYLKRSNNTEENMKADLSRNMLRDRVVESMSGAIEITDADISKYYEDNKQRFIEKEQVKAARILIRIDTKPGAAGDVQAAEAKAASLAKEIHQKASKPGADFAALAAQYSAGPEKGRRGELGWLTRGRMPAAFDNVAFSLEPNTVSQPVKTKDGFEIIRVMEKRPERQRTLDNVKDNIRNSLLARKRNEKRREVLRTLKKDAKVEHLIKFERRVPGAPGAPGAPPTAARPPVDVRAPKRPMPIRPLGRPGQPPMAKPGGAASPVQPTPTPGAASPAVPAAPAVD